MKYVLIILVVAYVGYQYFLKSEVYTRETVIKLVVSKKDEVCSNQGMLKDRKISKQQCIRVFEKNMNSCSSRVSQNIDSKKEADKALGKMLNCLTEFS